MTRKISKYRTVVCLLALATCLATGSFYVAWQRTRTVVAYNPKNLLRLHIVPDSDEPADQELKLRVRDALLKGLAPQFAGMKTAGEASRFVEENEHFVLDIVRSEIARSAPRQMDCRLEVGTFDFPDRAYGEVLVPSGKYRALRVVLGRGQGQNWWCVLFPPLCFKDLTTGDGDATAATETTALVTTANGDARAVAAASTRVTIVDEESLNEVRVEYRFKLVDWVRAGRERVLRAVARPKPGASPE